MLVRVVRGTKNENSGKYCTVLGKLGNEMEIR